MRLASRFSAAMAVIALAGLLQACGGGGGGGGSAVSVPSIDTGCFAAPTSAPGVAPTALITGTGSVVVTGTALFASVPSNNATGALDYPNTVNKPVRGAVVQAESSSGAVWASTTTSEQGTYSFTVPANTTFTVRLRPELTKTTGGATWNVAVRDNTVSGEPQQTVLTTPVFSGTAPLQKSITAGSGWGVNSYTSASARAAAPFAILDTIYASMKLVTSVQANAQFPPLTVYWSANNRPANGNVVLGEIGGTFFATSNNCASLERAMFVLGADGVDTDEYDSSVIAHEFGHYLQSAFSTDHSVGDSHGANDKLDMTLAFSEGWGNAFSSMARNNAIYADSSNFAQASGFTINMANAPGPSAVSRGWYGEDSVGTSLYLLFVNQGFAPIWTALNGPMKTSQDALSTIFSFADAVRSAGNATVNAAMNNILSLQNIFTGSTANQWGQGETNNGGDAGNLPIYTSLSLGVPTNACVIKSNLRTYPNGTQPVNKLGSVKYFRINLPSAGTRTITASFPQGGRDIDFEVFQKGVLRGVANTDAPSSEVGTLSLTAGEAVIRVVDYNVATVAAGTPCATIRID
jgi:hypothetical protein